MNPSKAEGSAANQFASTGVQGLDPVLRGGFTRDRIYLVEGRPGTGKTTLALQYLLAGRDAGERGLYVTLSESEGELRGVAVSHGWTLDGIDILEVVPTQESLHPDQHYTVFHPSEVELGATAMAILREVERLQPSRVVFDSLSELRLLAGEPLQYRRQVLALKQFFAGRGCTVVILDDAVQDFQVQSLVHGVLTLEAPAADFGSQRRRVRVVKYRGVAFHGGYHDMEIRRGGLRVFPRLMLSESSGNRNRDLLPTGIDALDTLLSGGIERGTSTLITGAAGSGKSSLAAQVAVAAARRGQRAALFIFDENIDTMQARCRGVGIALEDHVQTGRITLEQVDPGNLSPGEFSSRVAEAVDRGGACVVVIDSLNGYLNSMPNERHLLIQLHELLMYLAQRGVATLLVGVQHGLIGQQMNSPADTSYLADSVILLRYFEAFGEVRQAISVLKRRAGPHERTIREFGLGSAGIRIGAPLREFRGVLTGVPVYEGERTPLISREV